MLFWRLVQGHWQGTVRPRWCWPSRFSFIMFLVFIELMHSLLARIELGDTAVKMTLPSGRGPTPVVRYRTHEIPYDQIKAIETRARDLRRLGRAGIAEGRAHHPQGL